MTKIKIFRNANVNSLESLVNEFIKDKNIIDIKYVTEHVVTGYRGGIPSDSSFYDSCLIIYSEDQ